MDWKSVGTWLKDNAGAGASLVGSLLLGGPVAAAAKAVSMIAAATGEADPDKALAALQNEPGTLLKLKELAAREQESIREHIREMEEMRLKDAQAEHHETQETIRAGDRAEDRFVRWTRPAQSWVSLLAALGYAVASKSPSLELVALLLALPWAYAGLRQIGKGVDAVTTAKR